VKDQALDVVPVKVLQQAPCSSNVFKTPLPFQKRMQPSRSVKAALSTSITESAGDVFEALKVIFTVD